MITEDFKKMVAIMEKHGADDAALGGLILNYARYSAAIDEGHVVSDEEVNDELAEIRTQYEDYVGVSHGPMVGEFKGYIAAVGEDMFWDEIFAGKLRHQNTIGDWRRQAYDEEFSGRGISFKDRNRIEAAHDLESLAEVKVQVVDESLLKATPEQGLAYVQEYNAHMYSTE